MKNKNTITIALVLAVAVIALAFGSQSPVTNKLFSIEQKANAQAASQIPTSVLYDQVFRLTISFKTKAEAQQLNGEIVTAFSIYFKDEAQLTDRENEILQQVASEFVQEVQPVDDQAAILIEDFKKSAQDGNQNPPAELTDLQEQRNSLALNYRDQLNELFETQRFGEFDNFVHGAFASNFQPIVISQD